MIDAATMATPVADPSADEALAGDAMSVAVLANVCEAVVLAAGLKGTKSDNPREVRIRFEDAGGITLTIESGDGTVVSSALTDAEVEAQSDLEEDTES